MKHFVSALLIVCFSSSAFADCDFKTGISPLPDGAYRYSKECHIEVGIIKERLDNDEKAITDLKKAIDLKDLAIKAADDRTQLWMDTAFKLEERATSIENLRKKNDWLYFALGALTVLASGYVAAQLANH